MQTQSVLDDFRSMLDRAKTAVTRLFPLSGGDATATLSDVRWENTGDRVYHDTDLHYRAKTRDASVISKLVGTITIKKGSRVAAKQPNAVLLVLPHLTRRDSYVVNGKEVQMINQLLLRPAPYVAPSATTSSIDAKINAAGGGFKIHLIREGPKQGVFEMAVKTSTFPLYSILNAVGVSDSEMEQVWSKQVMSRNRAAHKADAPQRLMRVLRPTLTLAPGELGPALASYFESKEQDPDVTKLTLGKGFDRITKQHLLETTKKMLDVGERRREPDDPESVAFKRIRRPSDIVMDTLNKQLSTLKRNVIYRLEHSRELTPDRVMGTDVANTVRAVTRLFSASDFTRYTDQTNPLDIRNNNASVTVLGESGLQSQHSVTDAMRAVHPSHMGVLDPTATPEGSNIGLTNHLAGGARVINNKLGQRLFDTKKKRWTTKAVVDTYQSTIGFHDQYNWVGDRPVPKSKKVVARRGSDIVPVSPGEIDYIFDEPVSFLATSARGIPFVNNNDGNRVLMGGKHVEQAVPLVDPDRRLVQSEVRKGVGFEQAFGHEMAVKSPVDGKIVRVTKNTIVVKDDKGKRHPVQLHDNHPLNSMSFLTDNAAVKVGDTVKAGQPVAHNNFTRDGELAMGKQLNVAFAAYKGHNFEDGIVVSRGAAEKMTSRHKYEIEVEKGSNVDFGITPLISHFPQRATGIDKSRYDSDGVIKKGQKLHHGDVVVAAVRRQELHPDYDYSRLHRVFRDNYSDMSQYWDHSGVGRVVDVAKTRSAVRVFIEVDEPLQIGDKLSNSAGAKGIVTKIVENNEMYRTPDGKTVDLLFNPAGLPGRVNPGHMLEANAGLVAAKTGKTYLVRPFSGQNNLERVRKDMKDAGVPETIKLTAPDGSTIDKAGHGNMYWFKLKHVVNKKLGARSAGGAYTENDQPSRATGEQPQKLGTLEITSLLSHGANHFLRDAMAVKSQENSDYWNAVQTGLPTPPPNKPFVMDKFFSILKGAGVNVEQDGKHLKVLPVTDHDTLKWSRGALTSPAVVKADDLAPERGGLFDRSITGGIGGDHWSHYELETPVPNPVMESAIPHVLGLPTKTVKSIMDGKHFVTEDGQITDDHSKGVAHGDGLHRLLKKLDPKAEFDAIRAKLKAKKVPRSRLNDAVRRMNLLKSVIDLGKRPEDVYVIKHVPVIPPSFRPIYPLPDGSLNVSDINHIYRESMLLNKQAKSMARQGYDNKRMAGVRAALAHSVRAVVGLTEPFTRSHDFKGHIKQLKGATNKYGYFQSRVVARRQDLSARSTVIPDPKLGLDDVGVPWHIVKEIYRPFIIRQMKVASGIPPLRARDLLEKNDPLAKRAAEIVVEERPTLLTRAPALHKFSMLALKPRIVPGKAIEINPLVVKGFNMDFDGDSAGLHVPASEGARVEALTKLLPSQNLFSPRQDKLVHMPTAESIMGLHMMTVPRGKTVVKVKSKADALQQLSQKKIQANTPVRFGGKTWTAGQLLLNDLLPPALQFGNKSLNGREIERILTTLAKEDPKTASKVISQFKDFGNHYVTNLGWSVDISDLHMDHKTRDSILKRAEKESKVVGFDKAYGRAQKALQDHVLKQTENRFVQGNLAGTYGKADALARLLSAPVAVNDHRGRSIPVPLTKSYAEGQDMASYWASLPGARGGLIDRGINTRDTGALAKEIANVGWTVDVTERDCGTRAGIEVKFNGPDALDRVIAHGEPNAGKVLTPALRTRMRTNRRFKSANAMIKVRSPLTCVAHGGVCAKCFGPRENGQLPHKGYNVGALAAQSMTEPLTQMVLRNFHSAGALTRETVGYKRIAQILKMPANLPNKATIAMKSGKVTKVENVPGGWNAYVDDHPHFVPKELEPSRGKLATRAPVKVGDKIAAGQRISTYGVVKPQELLEATGNMDLVRNHVIDEVHKEMTNANVKVKRKLIETLVAPMTNRVEIADPGESPHVLQGDVMHTLHADKHNKELKRLGKTPMDIRPVLVPATRIPEHDADFFSRLMYQQPHRALQRAVQFGKTVKPEQAGPIASLILEPSMPHMFRRSHAS